MGKQIAVLVVDDSGFFRRRISEVIEQAADLTVVGTAENGLDAIKKAKELKPDVITMDVEMPVMNGIQAVREIMTVWPVPVLMFSSFTREGAKVTLDALDAGAVDFLLKDFINSDDRENAYMRLREKISFLGRKTNRGVLDSSARRLRSVTKDIPASLSTQAQPGIRSRYRLVVIGASTGGPVAVQEVLAKLSGDFPLPVVVLVHMPSAFTAAYAQRLDDVSDIAVKEAADGDPLVAGQVLLAPGGKQLMIESVHTRPVVKIRESLPDEIYKPSVDIGFSSAARCFGQNVLAIVLTGMGADGKSGAVDLKQAGATVWTQSGESCVVFGMPQSVEKAGLSDQVLPLNVIGESLSRVV